MLVCDLEDRMPWTEYVNWITYYQSKNPDGQPQDLAAMDNDAIGKMLNG